MISHSPLDEATMTETKATFKLNIDAVRDRLLQEGIDAFITSDEARQAYKLVPANVDLPKLYATEKEKDPVVWLKWFTPDADFTWYILEFDGEDICFGLTYREGFYPGEAELGYISLKEIEGLRGAMGLPVERDILWEPIRLSEVRAKLSDEDVPAEAAHETKKTEEVNVSNLRNMQMGDLRVHPAQMRTAINTEKLAGLVQQILTQGLDPNRPIVVADNGDVISGHRRWLAAMISFAVVEANPQAEDYHLGTIADLIEDIAEKVGGNLVDAYAYLQKEYANRTIGVASFDGDERAQILALQSANFGQEEADPKGLAQSFQAAIKAGVSVKQIAQNIGKKASFVETYLALAGLPDELVDLIVDGKLGMGIATALSGLPDAKRSALATVIAARTKQASPPTVSAVQAAVKRLKAFNGFVVPMTADPQERNKAAVIASLWQRTLNENPSKAWVIVADGAYQDVLREPWNKADLSTAFVGAFDSSLIGDNAVNWELAIGTHIPGALCDNCVARLLPGSEILRVDIDLPCRKVRPEVTVCTKFSTPSDYFELEVPWDWAGLPGVTEERPYRVSGAKALTNAWLARKEAERLEAEADLEAEQSAPSASPADETGTSGGKTQSPEKKPKAKSDAPKDDGPVVKMRAHVRDFMARHGELKGGDHPLATLCENCRHHRDSSPTKDESVPHCEWAGRLRKVEFSIRQPLNGTGQPIPWCRQYAPKESDWAKLIPDYDNAPDMPRTWIETQIKYYAEDVADKYNDGLLTPLTGKPMKSGDKYSDWFKKEFEKQVGNLSDSKLWMLYLWVVADWQRIRNRHDGVLFPTDTQAEIFGLYKIADWGKK